MSVKTLKMYLGADGQLQSRYSNRGGKRYAWSTSQRKRFPNSRELLIPIDLLQKFDEETTELLRAAREKGFTGVGEALEKNEYYWQALGGAKLFIKLFNLESVFVMDRFRSCVHNVMWED